MTASLLLLQFELAYVNPQVATHTWSLAACETEVNSNERPKAKTNFIAFLPKMMLAKPFLQEGACKPS